MVESDVVRHESEAGRKCLGAPTRPRVAELSNRLDMASQVAASHGSARPVSDVNALCAAIERTCSGDVPAVRHGATGDQSLEAVLSLYRDMAEEIEGEKRM